MFDRLGNTRIILDNKDATPLVRINSSAGGTPITITSLLNALLDTCSVIIEAPPWPFKAWDEIRIFSDDGYNGLHSTDTTRIDGVGDGNTAIFYPTPAGPKNYTDLTSAAVVSALNTTGKITISAWVKPAAGAYDASGRTFVYMGAESPFYPSIRLYKNTADELAVTIRTDDGTAYTESLASSPTTWTMISVTIDNATKTAIFYVDGVAIGSPIDYTGKTFTPASFTAIRVGNDNESGYLAALSGIAHVGVWSDEITAAELLILQVGQNKAFNATLDTKPVDALVGYWPLFEELNDTEAHEYAAKIAVFGGNVTHITQRIVGGDLIYSLLASDFGALLQGAIIKSEYTETLDGQIIRDLVAEHVPDFDISNVEDVVEHTRIRFNRISLFDTIQTLADYSGGNWFVDPRKRLYYVVTSVMPAPFDLADYATPPSTYPIETIDLSTDATGVINQVEVVGGNFLSEDQVIILSATGASPLLALPNRVRAPSFGSSVVIERNDGTDAVPAWTNLTVLVGHINQLSGPNEVLYYFQEKYIEQQNNWPALNNAVRITGRYEIPLRTVISDQSSIERFGRVFSATIVDDDITDKITASLAAVALLTERALDNPTLRVQTRQYGILSGQTVRVTHGVFDLDDEYLVQKARVTIGIGGNVITSLDLGQYQEDLIRMMVRITQGIARRPLWRDDEVLDQAQRFEEALILNTDAVANTQTQPPYRWGPTALATQGRWDFSTWS